MLVCNMQKSKIAGVESHDDDPVRMASQVGPAGSQHVIKAIQLNYLHLKVIRENG